MTPASPSQHLREAIRDLDNRDLEDTLDRWSPDTKGEPALDHRMMRALLNVSAFEADLARVHSGQRPIRNDYPLNLEP